MRCECQACHRRVHVLHVLHHCALITAVTAVLSDGRCGLNVDVHSRLRLRAPFDCRPMR